MEATRVKYDIDIQLRPKPNHLNGREILRVRTTDTGTLTYRLSSAGGTPYALSNISYKGMPLPTVPMRGETAEALASRICKVLEKHSYRLGEVIHAVEKTPDIDPASSYTTGEITRACEESGISEEQLVTILGKLSYARSQRLKAAVGD